MNASPAAIQLLDHVELDFDLGQPNVVTVTIELEPGSAGSPPHRHSGPVFAYLIEGELIFELEGEPARVIRAGEAFWEPGGDLIHYQAANNLDDGYTRFVAVMVCTPGQEMMTYPSAEELAERAHLRYREAA
ncbi:cupin domain-containing protein [Microbacterium yannicii]|uniref:cupin domain-containing protein n=1 Tax=Microbacterium yannicii TaxID=671622 RepID=UPI00031D0EF5|nr:cupin domain-containing protein [Microbacterium yannicii]